MPESLVGIAGPASSGQDATELFEAEENIARGLGGIWVGFQHSLVDFQAAGVIL